MQLQLGNYTALANLFKERNLSGNRFEYGYTLQALSLELLAETISATDMTIIYSVLGEVMGLVDSPDKHVPKENYFRQLRSKLDGALDKQTRDFIENAEVGFQINSHFKLIEIIIFENLYKYLMIGTDGSSHLGQSSFALGLFNQDLEWNCIELVQTSKKNAAGIAQEMEMACMKYGRVLLNKLVCIVSDRARVQEAANRIFMERLNRERGPEFPLLYYVCCLMHTVSNTDTRPQAMLNQAEKVLSYLKQFFGGRVTSSYSKLSLKREYEVLVGGTSPFETDCGSRFGVSFNNARSLILYENDVFQCLGAQTATHAKQRELRRMMQAEDTWRHTRLEVMVPFLTWCALISPFHTIVSAKETTYAMVKQAFLDFESKMSQIINEENGQHYLKLLELAQDEPDNSDESTQALDKIRPFWNELGANQQSRLHILVFNYTHQIKSTVESDKEIIMALPIGNDETRLPWTNRRCVSIQIIL